MKSQITRGKKYKIKSKKAKKKKIENKIIKCVMFYTTRIQHVKHVTHVAYISNIIIPHATYMWHMKCSVMLYMCRRGKCMFFMFIWLTEYFLFFFFFFFFFLFSVLFLVFSAYNLH